MADKGVTVTIDAKEFNRAIEMLPRLFRSNMIEAGHKIANRVIMTEGLKTYPPETSANRPPTPYYIRGIGTQHKGYNDIPDEGQTFEFGAVSNE